MHLLTLLLLITSTHAKLEPPEEPVTREMKKYIMRTTITLSAIYDTVGIVGSGEEYTNPIIDYMLMYKNTEAALIASRFNNYTYVKGKMVEKTKNLFCFVNTVRDFVDVLNYIDRNPFFAKSGYVQFIVGKAVANKAWLENKLKLIWSRDILNYVIVFQHKKTVEVIGYVPFNSSVYNYTNHPIGFKIYPKKTANLYGYTLNVGMFEDRPRHYVINEQLVGEDVNLVKVICQEINATLNLTYYRDMQKLIADVKEEVVDFSTTRFFMYTISNYIAKGSYPLNIDYLVMLVPTPGEMARYKYLFLIFDYKVWILLMCSAVLVILTYAYVTSSKSYFEAFLIFLQVYLNTAYPRFVTTNILTVRIVLITWALFSLLIITAFTTTLRSSLINVKYNAEINTIEDLLDSDLKVGINYKLYGDVIHRFNLLDDRLVRFNYNNDLVTAIQTGDKNLAYVVLESYAKLLTAQKDAKNRDVFKILNHNFLMGYNVYNFPEDSPYLVTINKLVSFTKQYGISEFGIGGLATENLVSGDDVKLSMEHMQAAFIILCIGCVLSFAAFLGEKVVYVKRKRDFIVFMK